MTGAGARAAAAGSPLLVVALDGPGGVGKSTVARGVADALGLCYLDTGAMYRALALAGSRRDVDPDDPEALRRLLAAIRLDLVPAPGGVAQVLLDGRPAGEEIRTAEVSRLASHFAARPEVRRAMVELQRDFGRRYGVVMEGRDIGTVVFPDAPHKFFLEARPEVRVERRYRQLRDRGVDATVSEVEAELTARDRRDRERSDSPLRWDESYVRLDTSELSADEAVAEIVAAVLKRSGSVPEGEGAPGRS